MLCQKYEAGRAGTRYKTWISEPCVVLRRDSLVEHQRRGMHSDAVKAAAAAAAAAETSGGIGQAFEVQFSLQRHAVIGAMKIVYWLCK